MRLIYMFSIFVFMNVALIALPSISFSESADLETKVSLLQEEIQKMKNEMTSFKNQLEGKQLGSFVCEAYCSKTNSSIEAESMVSNGATMVEAFNSIKSQCDRKPSIYSLITFRDGVYYTATMKDACIELPAKTVE